MTKQDKYVEIVLTSIFEVFLLSMIQRLELNANFIVLVSIYLQKSLFRF